MTTEDPLARSHDIATKVAVLFRKRAEFAGEQFTRRLADATQGDGGTNPTAVFTDWYSYAVDATQRSILFWDTLRQRGNNYREHKRQGQPPLLHFDYEMVVDGRKLRLQTHVYRKSGQEFVRNQGDNDFEILVRLEAVNAAMAPQ